MMPELQAPSDLLFVVKSVCAHLGGGVVAGAVVAS
jgi:hypothetical protein